jgi:uncharacterized protein
MPYPELELADWRRRVAGLYAEVRADDDPEHAHAHWRRVRDELIGKHPQSPALPGDLVRSAGVPYWPYDPQLRFELPLLPAAADDSVSIPTDSGNTTRLGLVGRLELPGPLAGSLDVWSLQQYASGLFVPVRDGTAGESSYGGGRYLLDTAKGADLGGESDTLIVDLNFLYHPSCRYNPAWQCPLAPPANVITAPIQAGERL